MNQGFIEDQRFTCFQSHWLEIFLYQFGLEVSKVWKTECSVHAFYVWKDLMAAGHKMQGAILGINIL